MLFFILLERKEVYILKCYTPVPMIIRDRVQKLSQDLEVVPTNKNPIPRISIPVHNYRRLKVMNWPGNYRLVLLQRDNWRRGISAATLRLRGLLTC